MSYIGKQGVGLTITDIGDQVAAGNHTHIRYLIFHLLSPTQDVTVQSDIGGDFIIPITGTILQSNTYKDRLAANVDTVGSGNQIIVDIDLGGNTIMTSTKISIDNGQKSSQTSAVQPVLTTTAVTAGDIVNFHVSNARGTTEAKGLKVMMAILETP